MKYTIKNLTSSPLSTDVGLLGPYESRSITFSPDQMYAAAAGFKALVDAGRVTIVTELEDALSDDAEVVTANMAMAPSGHAQLTDQYDQTTKYLYIFNGQIVISDTPP